MHAEVIVNQCIIQCLAQQHLVVKLCAVAALSVICIWCALDAMHTRDYIEHE
jgi:hypothetical protein